VTEQKFQASLEWLLEETRSMMEVFDVYQEIFRQIERNEIGAAVEADHLFWQVVVGSLLERLIVTLGRIFDKQKRARSVFKVLDAARDHIELFSRDALGPSARSDSW
jgi:hypothetical protein